MKQKTNAWENWFCPKCYGTEQWFDRTTTWDKNGNVVEGMTNRCTRCGISTDKWIKEKK
jgi:hypothetical protein